LDFLSSSVSRSGYSGLLCACSRFLETNENPTHPGRRFPAIARVEAFNEKRQLDGRRAAARVVTGKARRG
jgi:hypothetical protein